MQALVLDKLLKADQKASRELSLLVDKNRLFMKQEAEKKRKDLARCKVVSLMHK